MINIVQSGMDIPRAGLVGLWELHGAEQGLGLVRDISGYGEAAPGTFVGRPALLFGGSASHYLTPATEADRIPGAFAASGQYEIALEIRPVWPITGSGGIIAAPAADAYPQIRLTTAPRIQFAYKGMDGEIYTITSTHTLSLNQRACIRVRVIFSAGRPTLIVNNCTYSIPYDETGIEAHPISDDNVYDPEANETYVGMIGKDAHCYLTSLAFFNAALSNDESAHLARFPLHYMGSAFGGKLIDGIPFNEGTGATLTTKEGRTWSITGATWDIGTHGGQSWRRSSGALGDRFRVGGAEFDGVDDYIELGIPAKLAFVNRTNAYSVSLYFRHTPLVSGNRTLIARAGGSASNRHFWLYRSPSTASRLLLFLGGDNAGMTLSGLAEGVQYAVTITVPPAESGGKSYVNGVDTGDNLLVNNQATDDATPWRIGASLTAGTNYPGAIAAVAFHNRVLAPAEVAHLHAVWRSRYGALPGHSTQMRLSDEIATLLDGGTPEMSMPMFTTVDHATSTYVRNPDWLLSGVEGATSLCVACPSLTGNNITYRKVAKLTPHVCMVSWHARYVNQTYRWVTLDNEVINIASAPLPEGLTGYDTQGNCLRIDITDIGLYRMADAIPDSIDCLPIANPADHLVLADLASVLNIPLMGLLGGGVSHVNRVASPRLLYSAGGAKPWPDAAWFHQVEDKDSGSLIGYLTKSRFAAVAQLTSYGQGSAGLGHSLPSYIDAINQAIADLGYPDEQLTVAPVLGASAD